MTIKMKDVFELPVIDHGRNNLITEHRDETEAAIIAINAYDANQQKIAELKAMVDILKIVAKSLTNDATSHPGYRIVKTEFMDRLSDVLNKTPPQCLASVKADTAEHCHKLVVDAHDHNDAIFDAECYMVQLRDKSHE